MSGSRSQSLLHSVCLRFWRASFLSCAVVLLVSCIHSLRLVHSFLSSRACILLIPSVQPSRLMCPPATSDAIFLCPPTFISVLVSVASTTRETRFAPGVVCVLRHLHSALRRALHVVHSSVSQLLSLYAPYVCSDGVVEAITGYVIGPHPSPRQCRRPLSPTLTIVDNIVLPVFHRIPLF